MNTPQDSQTLTADSVMQLVLVKSAALLQVCEDQGFADNIMSQIFPDEKTRKGQPVGEGTKAARKAMNELKMALRAALNQGQG